MIRKGIFVGLRQYPNLNVNRVSVRGEQNVIPFPQTSTFLDRLNDDRRSWRAHRLCARLHVQ